MPPDMDTVGDPVETVSDRTRGQVRDISGRAAIVRIVLA
jgi:hypothetical protein